MTQRGLANAGTVGDTPVPVRCSPWRAVVGLGLVSLAADMVYEGARSITGPLLGSLGGTAVLVGFITGAGEAMALVLRVVFGPLADRSGRYWRLTFAGYAVTAVCVPALAITPFLAGAGLAVACLLILAERAGKAVRSPAKTALLAHAAGAVGAITGTLWPAMAVLIVPGAAALFVLAWIRRTMPDPAVSENASAPPALT